jgi:hypothetical protein
MTRKPILFIVALLSLLLATVSITGCTHGGATQVTFDQLFADPNEYNGKEITIEGFYFHGFETIVLSEKLELSSFAPGHLVPKGVMIWVDGGIPRDVEDKLNKQEKMGPVELYGKVRMTGRFEYGAKFGHLGSFDQQITPEETSVLPWSPPTSQTAGEGFAIYLTREDNPPAQMPALSHVTLAGQPIIGMNDIITYNSQTHELKLTPEAFERISKLDVPVQGKSFVGCVDRKPIYFGAFWTPISSISFDGVTIWKPLDVYEPYIITLELGYPTSSFYGGTDPRNSQEILAVFEKAGKLIDKLTIADIYSLPHAMKGYELYSWQTDKRWHFTLITGTNRNKALDEIVSGDDFVSEAGLVNVHVEGVDAAKSVIAKLPQNEFVIWLADMREPTSQQAINICLPPEAMVQDTKEYALARGIDFTVQAS